MGLFNKKDNGVNWQQEVFEISKTLPTMVEKLGNIDKSFSDHVTAGRKQRDEDKVWQSKVLENSLECMRGKQIDDMQGDVDTLRTDKVRRDGKFLGMKSVYAVILGVLGLIGAVLGIMWRLGFL